MKKALLVFLFVILPVIAQETQTYIDYFGQLNLTDVQKERVLRVREEENYVLRPLILDYHSKEDGLNFLKSLKCGFFDKTCKIKLKEDIELREQERNEALRKIKLKKAYYKTRYRNILTRAQDIELQRIIKEEEHKNKVIEERAQKEKRREFIDKLKFWKPKRGN